MPISMPSGGPVEPAAPRRTKARSSVARNAALRGPACHYTAKFERGTPVEACEPETRSSENVSRMQSFHRRYVERAPGRGVIPLAGAGSPSARLGEARLPTPAQPKRAALPLLTGDGSAALAPRLERSPRQPVATLSQPRSPLLPTIGPHPRWLSMAVTDGAKLARHSEHVRLIRHGSTRPPPGLNSPSRHPSHVDH